jgi:tetratricopeptide (TPR) repeat protein
MRKVLAGIVCALFISIFFNLSVAAENITDIEELFLRENYTAVIVKARELFNQNLSSAEKRRLSFLCGMAYLKLANTEKARELFGQAITSRADTLTISSKIGIADTFLLDNDFHEAIRRYKTILSDYGHRANESNIYFKLARSYQRIGAWDESKEYFRKVEKLYPLSFESRMAREELERNLFYFTVQAGSFADKNNALKLHDRLKREGYPVFIDQSQIGPHQYYRVRVGKFDKREQATRTEKDLKRIGLPTRIYP